MGDAERALTSGERIGRYELVMPIAKGGMASVSLARAEGVGGFDRYVAVKLTSEQLRHDPEFSAHLIEEAKLVAHLKHLNVVPVLDVGECERGVFLVMEYVPGDSLAGLLRRAREAGEPLPVRIGLRVLVDALQGLHAAHEHADEDGRPLELVHRDFSPQNILVGTDGIARLTDFGIAKAASRASNTVKGHIKGKISYVAPEQAKGGKVDRRADLWAAGVIAWELTTHRKLHGTSARALMEIVQTEPPRPSTVNPGIPPALDDAIAAVLKLDPGARTATAQELARELGSAANAANLLADSGEVAEIVTRLTASTLAERKETIARGRRQRMTYADVSSAPSDARSNTSVRRSLPSLPDVPISSVIQLEPARPSEPLVMVDAPAPEGLDSKPALAPASPRSHEGVEAPLRAPPSPILERPARRVAIYAAVGVSTVLVVVVTAVAAIGAGRSDGKPLASAPPGPSVAARPSETSATAKRTPPIAPADEGVWPTMLEITADAPIALLRINGRVDEIATPTTRVSLEMEHDDQGKDLEVVATSADGRVTKGTAKHGAGSLSFANAVVPVKKR